MLLLKRCTELTQMQTQRFWIERHPAKSHLGKAQCQARQRASWYRHMLQTRLLHAEAYSPLCWYDIHILLANTLPDRRDHHEQLIRRVLRRDQQRTEELAIAGSQR
jgi:hypothetical protein